MLAGRIFAVAAATATVMLSGAGAALAAPPYPPPGPGPKPAGFNGPNPAGHQPPGQCYQGSANKTIVTPGGTMTFSGPAGGFGNGESYGLFVFSTQQQVGSGQAATDGSFTTTVTIPSSLPAGRHTLEAYGNTSHNAVAVQFTVAAATASGSKGLPFTGADYVWPMTAAGAGLIVAGGLTMLSVRRKHRPRTSQAA
jgi:hypothetical protein